MLLSVSRFDELSLQKAPASLPRDISQRMPTMQTTNFFIPQESSPDFYVIPIRDDCAYAFISVLVRI